MGDAARLVASHLISLVGDASRHGIDLETISKELAVHSASVALAYLPPSDLHAIVDLIGIQAAKCHNGPQKTAKVIRFPERSLRPA
ncbi:MAG: hypothetical protein WCO61_04920 [Alphaproteobacteria bacterium]